MYQLIEKGMRQGRYIAQRYSKEKLKYTKSYNKNNPSNFISYVSISPYSTLYWCI